MKTATKNIIITKTGAVSKHIINALNNCHFAEKKVYTGYYSGSGRFTSAHSALSTVTSILDAQGYKYKVANDAPKGGIKGEHVVISNTAMTFLLSIKNA